jgi:hypothetical protein
MLAGLLGLLAAAPAAAQRMISLGMNPEQVRASFGEPARTRAEGDWSYWFYVNGCPNRCGSDDVVFFREEKVVAAVLRTRARHISSPPAADALEQAGGNEGAAEIRASASDEEGTPPPATPQRIRVRGRSRDNSAEGPEPARVGRIHVESGGRTIDRQPMGAVRDTPPEGGSATVIRAQPVGEGGRPEPADTHNPVGTASDSVQGAPATASDDARAVREAEVRRNTIPVQNDTVQARKRNRERSITPRVVPRP